MEYNVKGITFTNEDLTAIPLTEIEANTISGSHFFHLLPGGRKAILLLRAGDFIEPSFLTKYIEKGMESVQALKIVDDEDLITYKQLWSQLKATRNQRDQFMFRDQLVQKLAQDFWVSGEKSFLSFVIACFEEFYIYPPHVLEKFEETSMLLYTRGLLISSLSAVTSLVNGFVDYDFIKDFYNTAFIMDYGLIEYDNFNFAISKACENERNKPGSGLDTLKNMKRTEAEIQSFNLHPAVSYECAIEHKEHFSNPEVLEVVKMHHEKCDGTGFPGGYSYSSMSATETLLTFCDYMIPFQEHIFRLGDGKEILNSYFNQLKELDGNYVLPINKLVANWEMMMNWAIKPKEKVAS